MSKGTKVSPRIAAHRCRKRSNVRFHAAACSLAVAVSTPSRSHRTASKRSRVSWGLCMLPSPITRSFAKRSIVGGEHESESLSEIRGNMSLERIPDPAAYERANFRMALR